MLKIRRYYNQNKKTILKVTGFIVFFILLIQLLNYFAKRKNINDVSDNINNNPSFVNNSNYTDLSVSSDKSVLTNEKITTSSSGELEIINKFFNYCNNQKVNEAYSLLSDECKSTMYPKKSYFEKSYYKNIFNGNKMNVSVENWIGSTYKIKISENILASGRYDNSNAKQDFITVISDKESNYKLNINGYIERKEINEKKTMIDNVEMTVIGKDIYMDYEVYYFKIKNITNNSILMDNLQQVDSIYLKDKNDLKYYAYLHELSESQLLVRRGEEKIIKIKYYNKYQSGREIYSIGFSKVVINYESYKKLQDASLYNDYNEFIIDL